MLNIMFHKDLIREYRYNKSFLIELILKCVLECGCFKKNGLRKSVLRMNVF